MRPESAIISLSSHPQSGQRRRHAVSKSQTKSNRLKPADNVPRVLLSLGNAQGVGSYIQYGRLEWSPPSSRIEARKLLETPYRDMPPSLRWRDLWVLSDPPLKASLVGRLSLISIDIAKPVESSPHQLQQRLNRHVFITAGRRSTTHHRHHHRSKSSRQLCTYIHSCIRARQYNRITPRQSNPFMS